MSAPQPNWNFHLTFNFFIETQLSLISLMEEKWELQLREQGVPSKQNIQWEEKK